MIIKEITLLSKKEYKQYKSIIPDTDQYWWLKTVYPKYINCVYTILMDGELYFSNRNGKFGGVRPLCIFNFEFSDPGFWSKSDALIGSKIKCGKYNWTVLNVRSGEICALCDEVITKRRFDSKTNVWENSELKKWLETEGLKLITA